MKYLSLILILSLSGPAWAQDQVADEPDPVSTITELITEGKLDEAESALKAALRKNRNDKKLNRLQQTLAEKMAADGDNAGAAQQYSQFFLARSTSPAAVAKEIDKATECLERAIEDDSSNVRLQMLRRMYASSYSGLRKYKPAAEQYSKLLDWQLENPKSTPQAVYSTLSGARLYLPRARWESDCAVRLRRVP